MKRVLKNKTRQPQVFNLDAPFFVKNNNETLYGKPVSLGFLSLEKKEVPEEVMACTCIKDALKRGTLRDVTPPAVKPEVKISVKAKVKTAVEK